MRLQSWYMRNRCKISPMQINKVGKVMINQGDVYWVKLKNSDISHPHVVLQDDVFNHSRISTVIVCALTSNIKRVSTPGNVLLDAGEANLPKQSVVEVAKVSTLEKTQLGEYIGALSPRRVDQILAGMRFIQTSFLSAKVSDESEQG